MSYTPAATLADLGTWAATTVYAVGDAVTYSSRRYITKTAHTSTATFDVTKFTATDTGVIPKYDGAVQVYNKNALNFRRARAAAALSTSAQGLFKVCWMGNSIVYGSGTATPLTQAPPVQLRTLLTQKGLALGGSGYGSVALDPRWSGGTWTAFNSIAMSATGAGNGTRTFTSDVAGTSVTMRWLNAGAATATYSIDGGATSTLTAVAGSTINSVTVSGLANTTHTVAITWASGGTFYLSGASVQGASGVTISAYGLSGTKASATTGTTYTDQLPHVIAEAPQLVIVQYTVNEYLNQDALAMHSASLQTIITYLITNNADVMLVADPPNSNTALTIPYSAYVQNLYTLADTNNIVVCDLNDRWGSYAISNAAPLSLYNDTTHPNAKGSGDLARAVSSALPL